MCSGRREQGEPPLFIVLNGAMQTIEVTLPSLPDVRALGRALETAPTPADSATEIAAGSELHASPRSVLAFAGDGVMASAALRRRIASGRRDLPALGAGRPARRARARSRAPDAGAGGRLVRGARSPGRAPARSTGSASTARSRCRIPASHFQPRRRERAERGRSITTASRGRHRDWRGRPWQRRRDLELHVGTFTPGGTFRAAIERLDHVVDAGITAIELMPIADFAGRRNWGYDGVLLYAPDSSYGRPDDLRSLDRRRACARADGVSRRRLQSLRPRRKLSAPLRAGRSSPRAHTPWGAAIDYRVPQVRAFAIENALHWLTRYRFDGLRLDAVHAIVEPGQPSILHDLSRAVGAPRAARPAARSISCSRTTTIAQACSIRATNPPQGQYRAQWNDDYHHAWHVLLTGERDGYYRDYAAEPAPPHRAHVGARASPIRAKLSPHRRGRRAAKPPAHLPPLAFVNFLQNHDQIGNRPLGDRLATQADDGAARGGARRHAARADAAAPVHGRGMGLERSRFRSSATSPSRWRPAVRNGRREEFKAAYAALGGDIPDPLAEATFRSAMLDWGARSSGGRAAGGCDLVRELLAIRRREITPHLAGIDVRRGAVRQGGADRALAARRRHALSSCWPICRMPDADPPAGIPSGATDLGRRYGERARALDGVLEHRSGMMPPSIPIATYRVQFTPSFGFDDAAAAVPYLKALGHQSSLCVALSQGTRGQHARL